MANKLAKTAMIGLLALFMALPVAPLVAAATVSFNPGTQVAFGDGDFIPTAAGANTVLAAANVIEIDLGTAGQVTDNCFYYHPGAGIVPVTNDIRLTPCQGKAAGTQVTDADTVEKTGLGVASGYTSIQYADVNNDGRYDQGDYVFLTTAGVGGLAASTGNAVWTIRLTASGGKSAGSLVYAGDSDLVSYGAATKAMPAGTGVAFFDADNTGTITPGDFVYVASAATGAGVLFPQFSIRLLGGSGAFGSQTKFGDADFAPTAFGGNTPLAAANVVEIDLGTAGQVTDNCFYYHPAGGAPVAPVTNDVRLTACQGKAAGTLVTDADTVEKTGLAVASGFTSVQYADVNNNGRYDQGDYVFLTTAAVGGLAASTGNGVWTIRLTPSGGKAIGTLVFAGDSDLVSYGGATKAMPAGTGMSLFDADNTGTITPGDFVYLATAATGAGALFPQFSIRLVGGAGPFGSQVMFGDADFVPTSVGANTPLAAANIVEIDLGTAGQVTDNCFYYHPAGGAPVAPATNDIRLVGCQGKNFGTFVTDADTVEKTGLAVASGFTSVQYADVNNDGRYDQGDYVYITTAAVGGLAASTGNGVWTIRLTPAGGKAAGTLVYAGDSDLVSYGAATKAMPGGTGAAFFDSDATGTVTSGDNVYLATAATGVGKPFPLYSIRLTGVTASTTTPGQGGTTTCPAGQTLVNGSCTATTSPNGTGTPPATTPPPSSELQQLLQQITALNEKLNTSASQNADLTARIASLSATLQNQTTQLNNLQTSLTQAQEQNKALQDQLNAQKQNPPKTPGFEAVAALGAIGVAVLVLRRRDW